MAKPEAEPTRYEKVVGVFGLRFEVGARKSGQTNPPEYSNYDAIVKVLGSFSGYSQGRIKFISGGSKGVEKLVERWCRECDVPFERIRPDTDNPDSSITEAFNARNATIISMCTEILILWDGQEKNFDNIAKHAVLFNKKVTYVPVLS